MWFFGYEHTLTEKQLNDYKFIAKVIAVSPEI